jgi:hypothetical protein
MKITEKELDFEENRNKDQWKKIKSNLINFLSLSFCHHLWEICPWMSTNYVQTFYAHSSMALKYICRQFQLKTEATLSNLLT